jgi:hypothetical protein
MTQNRTSLLALAAIALAALALGACRDEEQNRVLRFKPGIYQGAAPTPVPADKKQALVDRVKTQQF